MWNVTWKWQWKLLGIFMVRMFSQNDKMLDERVRFYGFYQVFYMLCMLFSLINEYHHSYICKFSDVDQILNCMSAIIWDFVFKVDCSVSTHTNIVIERNNISVTIVTTKPNRYNIFTTISDIVLKPAKHFQLTQRT